MTVRIPGQHDDPRHRLRRIHRDACREAAAREWRHGRRRGQPQSILRRSAQGSAAARAHRVRAVSVRKLDLADRPAHRAPVPGFEKPSRLSTLLRRPACATRCRTRTPTCRATWSASRTSSSRAGTAASSISSTRARRASTARTSRCRSRGRPGRPSGQSVRGDQARERVDGAHLQSSLRAADDRAALLHGLRPVGSAGHVDGAVHQGDPRGRADQGLQPRQHAARLHVCRRHRGGRRARARPDPAGRAASTPRTPTRGRRRALRRSESTTSATASRSSCSTTSALLERRSGRTRSSTCSRCNPATCVATAADTTALEAAVGFRPGRRSTKASGATSTGIARTTARPRRAGRRRWALGRRQVRFSGEVGGLSEHRGIRAACSFTAFDRRGQGAHPLLVRRIPAPALCRAASPLPISRLRPRANGRVWQTRS